MTDHRTENTRHAIKEALLRLLAAKPLAQVTVAELAAEAGVSRSTFYVHYANTQRVLTALVRDFLREVRPLPTQLRCAACREVLGAGEDEAAPRGDGSGPAEDQALLREADGGTAPAASVPFCVALRDGGRWRPLVRDPLFLPTVLALIENEDNPALNAYHALDLDGELARTLYRFQMTGCYAAALAHDRDDSWPRAQAAIDTFIRGGMNALRTR